MKPMFWMLPAALLLSGCTPPQVPAESRTATPSEIAQQMLEYQQKSDRLVEGVNAALTPGATAQSIASLRLSPQLTTSLVALRGDVVRQFPQLMNRPVWLAESSQLVRADESDKVTGNLTGLFILATTAEDDPLKTAWVATVTVDMTRGTIASTRLNTALKGGFRPAPMQYLGEDGRVPLVRRVASDPDPAHWNDLRQLTVPTPASEVFIYSPQGVRRR